MIDSWKTGLSGNWNNDPTDWSTGTPPNAGDDAQIANGNVTITSQIAAISSLTLGTAGLLTIHSAGVVQSITGSLSNSGNLDLDSNGIGGSALTVGGTLINSGNLAIGNTGLTAATVLTVGGLTNTGNILLVGNVGTSIQATLAVTGATPTTWTGLTRIAGDADLELQNGISVIAAGATFELDGATARASIGADTANTALTGLSQNAGALNLGSTGVTLTIPGYFKNAGSMNMDFNGTGGNTVTIGSTFNNSGALSIGSTILETSSTFTTSALVNTGAILLQGNAAAGATAQAVLASTVTNSYTWTGSIRIVGDADLVLTNSITTIASGASIALNGAEAGITLASYHGTDTEIGLFALTSNAGGLDVGGAGAAGGVYLRASGRPPHPYTASVLYNSGSVRVDFNGAGGSTFRVLGELNNSGIIGIGNSGISAASTLEPLELVNTGVINLFGNSTSAGKLLGDGNVSNSGTINATGGTANGVQLSPFSHGFHVSNSGVIAGKIGVVAGGYGTTVFNSGTISGAGGTAVSFGGTSANLLVLQHGYKLVGGVVGGASATNTVALAGSVGATVAADYNGLHLTAFQDVLFGAGAQSTLKVSNIGGTLPVTISGFATAGDVIDLTAIGSNGTIANFDMVSHLVTVTGSLGSETLRFDASDATALTTTSDGSGGTDVEVPCFCRGTLILTERGEVPVEDLAVGDLVVTQSGVFKPIVWIGFGRDLVTRANKLARPVIVESGALSDGVPTRDLYLTHGHALYLDSAIGGVLIPVENLINHRSIRWDESARVVEYYHIELDDHDVVLANGAPAESYHDAGNRAAFQNNRPAARPRIATTTFAPVLTAGEVVGTVWERLFARAGGRIEPGVTAEPDLYLMVDGKRIDPQASGHGVYRFAVPRPPAARLVLRSRSGVPSLLGISRHDHRRLGVAITQLVLLQAGIPTYFDCDQPQLREGGSYRHEDGFCWTDGELDLPARFFTLLDGAFSLAVHTEPHPDMRYALPRMLADAA